MNPEINKAFIFTSGDRSVGIPSASFEMEIYLPANEPRETLESFRQEIKELYEGMCGETPKVVFDYEFYERTNEKERD